MTLILRRVIHVSIVSFAWLIVQLSDGQMAEAKEKWVLDPLQIESLKESIS